MRQGIANLEKDRFDHIFFQLLVFREQVFETHTVEVVHNQIWPPILAFETIEDGDDIGMAKAAQGARFLLNLATTSFSSKRSRLRDLMATSRFIKSWRAL